MKNIKCAICGNDMQEDAFITCGLGNADTSFEISICKDCFKNKSEEDIANAIDAYEQITLAHKDFVKH